MKSSKVKAKLSAKSHRSGITELCEELLKKRPNKKLVESLMRDHGIPFEKDPLLQIGAVLENLNEKGNPNDESSL